MSLIQNLRNKYAKLTGGIIVVALLAFVFMDIGRGGHKGDTTVGKVDGQKISVTEYDAEVQQAEKQLERQNQVQMLDATQEAQLRDQVWKQLVAEHLIADMNQKLGLRMTQAEVNNLLTGPNPDPLVKRWFSDPKTGVFNPQEAAVEIQQTKNDPTKKVVWDSFMKDLKRRHLNQKVTTLFSSALYVPKFIVANQIKGITDVVNAKYVKIPFTSVSDKEANVTDTDINKYIQAHPNQFKIPKATRTIEYVSFKVIPSAADSARVLKPLDTLKNAFATTKDVAGFVNHFSENATPPTYFTHAQLKMLPNVNEIMNAAPNQIIGPFYDGQSFQLARVVAKELLPDSSRSRHIFVIISNGKRDFRTEAQAKARIDSAIAALNAGVPFDSVVLKYSDDQYSQKAGSKGQSFVLAQKNSLQNSYGKEFSDFIFEGKVGEHKLIKEKNDNYTAYNYVQILSQSAREPVIKLAFISRELLPNDVTYGNIRAKANTFATDALKDKTSFEKTAENQGLQVKTAPGIDKNSALVTGLGAANGLVKWAYSEDTKLGDISPVNLVGQDFVVAKLVSIQPKGLLKVNDQNRTMLRALVMKDKKAKIIADKYKTATASLDALAQQTHQVISNLDSIRFVQSFIRGLGSEPKVVGYAFNPNLKLNTVSAAIPGNEGVYFLSVTGKATAPLTPTTNKAQIKNQMLMNLQHSAPRALISSMIENADVKDQRSDIF